MLPQHRSNAPSNGASAAPVTIRRMLQRTLDDIARIEAYLASTHKAEPRAIAAVLGMTKAVVNMRLATMRELGLAYGTPPARHTRSFIPTTWQLGASPLEVAEQGPKRGAAPCRPVVKTWTPCMQRDPMVAALFGSAPVAHHAAQVAA